ncbi:polysaccharide deacetylase family protein [Paenibacillus silagei]|uniref:Glycoside hydrolase/deacetylase ChbG (UPF0249 family) n=1 Tax=Paenibacillus silagei TaxID=1670801 RepID=A0ABS4NVM5_9BACL|nr:polysaccharide deacetylase family protein [Paenibacillus silagei]MBP2114118.1 putative glycoside hydrolase/deacetylase ChbG (UPF0249 family) [Paenibacillus silagei]
MISKLGFSSDDRLLIINADDFGITKGTNEAIVSLFEQQAITSTSIMFPCPAAREALKFSNQNILDNIGIHLTLTSGEHHSYSPVCQERPLKSLINKNGKFHNDISYIEENADDEEVRIELEAQIQSATMLGIDPTHLDSHGGSIMGLYAGNDFLEITFDLCEKYRLPFNLPTRIIEQPFFNNKQKETFRIRINSGRKRGILFIDDVISLPYCCKPVEYEEMKRQLLTLLKNIKPGITQLTIHPSKITEELKSVTNCYFERGIEYLLLVDPDIKKVLKKENINLISWKEIRDLQRILT